VSKLAAEQYCRVFSELYGLETVVLRYFNVFGPRQRPDSAYAAVIPLFIDALAGGDAPTIHGDGKQTRDLTYVSDVVRANLVAIAAPGERRGGKIYNVSEGKRWLLLELLEALEELVGCRVEPRFTAPRSGDVRHSEADITAAGCDLGYLPLVGLHAGLRETVEWQMSSARADGA
jgi:UDP-glucose 4-epimerase